MNLFENISEKKLKETVPTLRLNNPAHPAQQQLRQVTKIIDQNVQVEVVGDHTVTKISAPAEDLMTALKNLDEAITLCPNDMDLLVVKATILNVSAQFKSAEEMLDLVLSQDPDHFEAKMWKNYWETWSDALRYPKWDEQSSSLHPVMATHLNIGHHVQIVRDGMQKTLAIVTGVQGPPFDKRTQVKVDWVLSKTPYGPLVAYYPKVIEPSGEPSIMEAFLPIFQPQFNQVSPLEGYFLIQQLAFTPYFFLTLTSGNDVLLNRKIFPGEKTISKIRDITSELVSSRSYLPQHQFQSAMQWHMNNFDMSQLTFE
ncbi:MAG: tetratricopeptide repeat protein [Bacteroidetes bacterium]|nr:MAG: tetratricopeptide repeat protein [Bacteroidota bacterium]